jgi:mRNA interferase RelE/StbE
MVSVQIAYTSAATRQWLGLVADVRRRIEAKLTSFANTGHGDVKRLKGRGGVRLRVGNWRVIFYVEEDTIVVVAVGHRREIYD